jgi:hypothetical protein
VGCCNTTFTLSNYPSAFTCTSKFDIIDGKSPNKIKAFDVCITSVCSTAKTLVFTNASLKETDPRSTTATTVTYSVGDTIAVAEQTKFPQLPADLRPLLAQKSAVKMLEGLTDTEALKNAATELDKMEKRLGITIDNRIESAPQKVVNRNGLLQGALFNNRFRRRGF